MSGLAGWNARNTALGHTLRPYRLPILGGIVTAGSWAATQAANWAGSKRPFSEVTSSSGDRAEKWRKGNPAHQVAGLTGGMARKYTPKKRGNGRWSRGRFTSYKRSYKPRFRSFKPASGETKTHGNAIGYQQMGDNLAVGTTLLTSSFGGKCMNAIPQGNAQSNRIGKKYAVTGIFARLSMFLDKEDVGSIGHTESVRIIIFVDKANNSIDKTNASGLLVANTGFEQALAYRNMDNTVRYRVLFDQWIPLTGTTGQYDLNKWSVHKDAFIEINLPKIWVPVQASSPTGATGTSIQSGAIYCAAISSDAASGNSQIHGDIKVHFKDI